MGRMEAGYLYGMLELLILKMLSEGGPMHGLAIAQQITRRSGDSLRIGEGSLYPALYRLRGRGLVESEWLISDKKKRAKYYALTPRGERWLQKAMKSWVSNTRAVLRVLDLAWLDLQ
jgi:PadR family transcriptional regulator PadR